MLQKIQTTSSNLNSFFETFFLLSKSKRPAIVVVSPKVDEQISELFPIKPSGEYNLPSQHEFVTQAMPYIIETFATIFDSMRMPIPSHEDYRVANFENLTVPLITVFARRIHSISIGLPDQIQLINIRIVTKRKIYENEIPKDQE